MVGGLGEAEPVGVREGEAADLDDLVSRLVEIGYGRSELVERRGGLAVRGGILDVSPPTEEHPLRIEFFGDTVEEIRFFRVADQRSLEGAAPGLWAPPWRELLLTPAVRNRAKQLAYEWPGLSDVLSKLAEGITVEAMEAFAPVLAERMELLLDYVPSGGCVLACDPERIRTRAAELVSTSQEFLEASWVNAAAGGEVPIDLGAAAFRPITEVRSVAQSAGLPWWTVTPFAADDSGAPDAPAGSPALGHDLSGEGGERPSFRMEARPAEAYRGDTARVVADVSRWLADRWRAVLVTEGHRPAQPRAGVLRGAGPGARRRDSAAPRGGPGGAAPRTAGGGGAVAGGGGAGRARGGGRGRGQDQGPGAQGGAGDRRGAHPAVLGATRLARPCLRAGHAVAARAGGRLPLRRDAGPAGRHRRGQARHGAAGPDGPADLRRRRLRQDRDPGAGPVQGRPGPPAGGRAGADHAAGPAAPRHVQRAVRAVPGGDQADVEVPERRRDRRDPGRPGRGQGRRGDRHAPAALGGGQVPAAGPGDHRRGP